MLNFKEIGENVKKERITQKYSLNKMSFMIGWSKDLIVNAENGKPYSYDILIDMHEILGMDYEYIITEIERIDWGLEEAMRKMYGDSCLEDPKDFLRMMLEFNKSFKEERSESDDSEKND